ncbi:50S ribosomal protein L10 [Candidatus Nomurabacteria bacterium]|nr:50S ribosomal protein L10 [Candidatus Nomurabacteria bacterium]
MAINKEQKRAIVSSFAGILAEASSLVFVKFDKLTVADAQALRRQLRAAGVGYRVGKKTLIKRALAERSYEGSLPELEGEIAVAYGTDPIAPAREVFDFQKTHKDNVSIVGGILEGAYKDQAYMMSIATIPSRETLLSQIAFLLKSPMQRLAIAVKEVAKKQG